MKKTTFLILIFFYTTSLYSGSGTWQGQTNGATWNSTNHWSLNSIPNGTNDVATFNNDLSQPYINGKFRLKTLQHDGSGALSFSNTTLGTLIFANTTSSFLNVTNSSASFDSGSNVSISLVSNVPLTITNAGSVTFRKLSGSSTTSLIKEGASTLHIRNDSSNTFFGSIDINAGCVDLAGSLGDTTVTIFSGGALKGTGSITGLVRNWSSLRPGSQSPGTSLNIGSYSQKETGKLIIDLNTDTSSQLTVSGVAGIAGTLQLNVASGNYPANKQYTIIQAGSPISGTFSSITTGTENASSFTVSKSNNDLILTINNSNGLIVTPVEQTNLKGNDKHMSDYMFSDASFINSDADLTRVGDATLALAPEDFEMSLIRLSPLSTAGHHQAYLRNDVEMAIVLDNQFHSTINEVNNTDQKEVPLKDFCYNVPKTGFFIQPIGVFYNQRETKGSLTNRGQVPFWSFTYGAGFGWDEILDDQFVVEGGMGYTHSNLSWSQGFGNSKWSTIYIAPFFGWFNQKYFANFMIMGGLNLLNTERRITFTGIRRIAKSKYSSYDLLLRGNGGAKFSIGYGMMLQPEGTLNYLTIFTDKYTEKGAGSVNLQVKRQTNFIMQPSFRTRFVYEFKTPKFAYAPNIYVGWLANIQLGDTNIRARFKEAPNQIFFTIQGFRDTINQLVLGAEFFAHRFNQFEITTTFEADILSRLEVYSTKLKFQWLF